MATIPVDMDLENWLESTGTNQESMEKVGQILHSCAELLSLCKVRMAMDAEVCGGTKTGMNAHKDEKGRLCFTHTYALLVGRKATM